MLLTQSEKLILNHDLGPRWVLANNQIEEALRAYADQIKYFLQTEAYSNATALADKVEAQYSCHYFDETHAHFSLFRIFANAAEAHDALGDPSQARHFRKLALDQHMEAQAEVDCEIMCLLLI
jgi:hypothetical protein